MQSPLDTNSNRSDGSDRRRKRKKSSSLSRIRAAVAILFLGSSAITLHEVFVKTISSSMPTGTPSKLDDAKALASQRVVIDKKGKLRSSVGKVDAQLIKKLAHSAKLGRTKLTKNDDNGKLLLQKIRSSGRRIIIDGNTFWNQSGGPEALIQLALAFYEIMPTLTYFWYAPSLQNPRIRIGDRFRREYTEVTAIPTVTSRDFRRGDILILPEAHDCNAAWVDKGVQIYFWVLRVRRESYQVEKEAAGCGVIAHNHYIRDVNLQGAVNISQRPHLLRPYVTPSIIRHAPTEFVLRSERIVWMNNEVKQEAVVLIQSVCTNPTYRLNCTARTVTGFQQSELPAAYQRGTIIFEQGMKGSERIVLEAVIHGNIFLTTDSWGSKSRDDFPMPERNVLPAAASSQVLADAIRRIFDNYEQEWKSFADFRKLYRDNISHNSLVSEARVFLLDMLVNATERLD